MESIYAALLLHKVGGKITEVSVEKVLTAAGAKVDKTEITKLIAGLKGTKLEDVIKAVGAVPVAAAPAGKRAYPRRLVQYRACHPAPLPRELLFPF